MKLELCVQIIILDYIHHTHFKFDMVVTLYPHRLITKIKTTTNNVSNGEFQ